MKMRQSSHDPSSRRRNSRNQKRWSFLRRSNPSRSRAQRPLGLESLEVRQLLAVILWTDRGDNNGADSDNFVAAYGAVNGPVARAIVDRAIDDWESVIDDFNYLAFGAGGQPVADNTYTISIVAADQGGGGRGVTQNVQADAQGKPYDADIQMDDDGGGAGWFFDTTPVDDSEFTTLIASFTADGSNTLNGNDFYRTIVHEMGHAMGIASTAALAIHNFETAYGTDPNDGTSTLFLFQGATVTASLTSNGGRHVYEGPAVAGNPTHPNDLLNAGRTVGFPPPTRQLITDLDSLILRDAYGYVINELPSQVNTFHANFNSTTGVLTVNGGPGASNDQILIDMNGSLRVQVNGTEETFDGALVTSISVLAGAGDDSVIISPDVGLAVTIDPGTGNDRVFVGSSVTSVTSVAADGNDLIDFSNSPIGVSFTGNGADTIVGTPFNDVLTCGAGGGALLGGDGDDRFNVSGGLTGALAIEGGSPSASDVLFLAGGVGLLENVTIAPDASDPTQQVVTGLGATVNVSGVELIRYTGVGTNDTLTVATGPGDDTVRVQGGVTRDVVTSNSLPPIEFSGLNTFVLDVLNGLDTATFATGDLNGAVRANYQVVSTSGDVLVIEGFDSASPALGDTFTVTNPAGGNHLAITHINSAFGPVTVTNTGAAPAVGRLQINGLGGDDSVTVDVNSPASDLIQFTGITYDGGVGLDQLSVVGAPATAVDEVIYAPGPDVTRGQLFYENAANVTLMQIEFANLEPVFDAVLAATLRVHGTNSDNVIDYRTGGVPGHGRVTVDTYEAIHFTNKANLILNGFAGSDTISLDNPNTPTGLTSITVNGGEPTAGSDTVVVNGTAALDLISVDLLTQDGARITGAQPVSVTVAGTELLIVNGQNGADTLTYVTPAGSHFVEYTPGGISDPDTGSLRTLDNTNRTMLSVDFQDLGDSGSLTLADAGGGRADALFVNGTDNDDKFAVLSSGVFQVRATPVEFKVSVSVNTPGIGELELRGLDGSDIFSIAGNHPFPGIYSGTGVRVQGGNPDSGSDVLDFIGAGGAVIVELSANTVVEAGSGAVFHSGVERVNINSANLTSTLSVNGTVGEDDIEFQPSSGGTGTFTAVTSGQLVATHPVFTYLVAAAGLISVNTQGNFDTLGLIATSGNDVVNAVQSAVNTLNYTQNTFTQNFTVINVDKVKLSTLSGDDLIRVSVSDALVAAPSNSLVFDVDGGSPNASDRLIVNDDGIGDLTIIRQAPDQRSGSVTVGALNPVFYQNAERLDVTPVNSITGGVGTDGNGRIDVFHSDPFEYNETRLTAATLSRVGENPTGPTIDPGAVVAPFSVPGDEDWYEFRPLATGTFAVKILFDLQGPLANGRAGLPGAGNLNLEIYDANGVLITSGVVAPGGKEAIFGATNDPAFPQFNRIFVRVHGTTPDSINHYEFDKLAEVGTGNPGVGNADLFGPQVTDVQANSVPSAVYNLFNSKDAGNALHPTPLTNSLTISFRDPPPRAPGFLYPALDPNTATTPGTYVVKGDATGIAAISSIILVNNPVVVGGVPTATVQIVFAKPLPDDRFTLTINDNLEDPAGNSLDGESNAAEPNGGPSLPSGDGEAGGDFVARFTIDSRVELGAFSAGSVYVDTNGNYLFDPTNTDSTNRDITYLMGFTSDNILAGNFVKAPAGVADGFDKLAAYGKFGTNYRWIIDVNNDGIVNGTDVNVVQPLFAGVTSVNGTPVAGNFDGNAANGDEVALKVGNTWLLDKVGHDFKVDTKLGGSNMVGLPIVGDFDGDGIDDLGSWADDKFYLNLSTLGAIDGTADRIFGFGFSGVRERPVAGDFDADGITDLGLWVPDRSGVAPSEAAEWYLLLSGGNTVGTGTSIVTRLAAGGGVINFTPTPFGNDLYAQFGDEFGLPVPGNFDPPLTPTQVAGSFTNSRDKVDVDNDGFVSPIDALLIINRLNSDDTTLTSTPFAHAPFVDVNGDGICAPIDALMVINYLNSQSGSSTPAGEGEGDTSADAFFSDLGSSDGSLSVLLAIDDYHVSRKK